MLLVNKDVHIKLKTRLIQLKLKYHRARQWGRCGPMTAGSDRYSAEASCSLGA